jgi:hypothetical protein
VDGFGSLRRTPKGASTKRTAARRLMGDVLSYARVSTGDQDVAGQTMRLEQAGAIKVFTDVRSGKSMDRARPRRTLGLCEERRHARRGPPRPPRTLAGGIACHGRRFERTRNRVVEPGRENRHVVSRRRARLSCVRRHRPFRASSHRRADQRRNLRRSRQRQAPRPEARRCRKSARRPQTCRRRTIANRCGQAARPWTVDCIS